MTYFEDGRDERAIIDSYHDLPSAYIPYKTYRIESSFLVHFLVNLTHIFLFTYPSLVHTP